MSSDVPSSIRQRMLASAVERQARLDKSPPSPEFRAWFDQYIDDLAAVPFTDFDAYVLARSHGQLEACITHEPQLDSEPEVPLSCLSLIRKSEETDLPQLPVLPY
jgi:hypothetical protein